MVRVALKSLAGHKLRFALTTVAVILGVTFVAGTFVLTDSIDDAFAGLLDSAYEGSDITVRAASAVGNATTEQPGAGPTLPAGLHDDIAAVDGVEVVAGSILGTAVFADRDGEPLVSQGPPTLAFSWTDGPSPLTLRDGRAPRAAGEVTMDAGTADRGDFGVGDTVTVALPQEVQTFEIVGITGFGESDNLLGASIATFDLATARDLFDKQGRFDEFAVAVADDAEATVVRDRLDAALGADVAVVTTDQEIASSQADISEGLGFITTALLAFAGVALFVGSFIIVNTFSIVVAQRTREFALLRAVGASARQVRWAVLLEAAVVGLVAAAAGLLLGIGFATGLKGVLASFGVDIPAGTTVVALRTVVVSFVVGIGVTVLAAIQPARRAATVAPVEAMRASAAEETSLRRRTATGAAVAALGAAVLLVGLVAEVANALAVVGGGALVSLLGVALLAPALARPTARLLGALPGRLSIASRIATRNSESNPRRTATTASALMIGLALVTFVTVFAASIRGAVADLLNEQFRADFIVATETPGLQNLPASVASELDALDETATVTAVRFTSWSDGAVERFVSGVDPAAIRDVVGVEVTAGAISELGRPDTVMMQEEALTDRGLEVGDAVEMSFALAADVPMQVVGTLASTDLLGAPYVVSHDTLVNRAGKVADSAVYVNAAGRPDAAQAAITGAVAGTPGVEVQDQASFREEQEGQVNQVLGLMMVLLALAVIVALLGIANTLALSVFERTREIGLLRAVGMTRRQTRRMVTWESVIVAVFGALLGLGVGTLFGWAVVAALAEEGITTLVVPGGQLVVYLVAAGVAGVVAATFPAWRAARLDVLEAVTTE